MKAILMSIRPQHLVNILNGKKTIEIRKTMPKCALPIDVYIYCTKDKKYANLINRGGFLTGMVVAKFTLNKVEKIKNNLAMRFFTKTSNEKELLEKSCLNSDQLFWYLAPQELKVKCCGYAWHISNLEIFDKPKELGEFSVERYAEMPNGVFPCYEPLTKAPQSWQYVEVEDDNSNETLRKEKQL